MSNFSVFRKSIDAKVFLKDALNLLLLKVIGYYDSTYLRRYLDELIECNMVKHDNNLYYISEFGLSTVQNISGSS